MNVVFPLHQFPQESCLVTSVARLYYNLDALVRRSCRLFLLLIVFSQSVSHQDETRHLGNAGSKGGRWQRCSRDAAETQRRRGQSDRANYRRLALDAGFQYIIQSREGDWLAYAEELVEVKYCSRTAAAQQAQHYHY
jgi:hypothetical protein